MRKNIYHIGMLAVAALAFIACEKENNFVNNVEVTHYATISLGKADDTKTMVVEGQDGASYKWNDDDDKYLRVTENGTVGTIESFSLSADKTIATLTVSFTGTPEAPYTYEAKYAGSFSNNGNPKLSAEQTPLSNTFDPSADVLYSKAITSENSRLNELSFTMGRVVTVNKMTLTGLEAGEVISKVEFTLDKTINGSTSITYDSDSNKYNYNGTKKLTFNYDSTTGVVPADGKFPVYFTAVPVDAAPIVSVVVTTDKNVYTKSTSCNPNPFDGKTITFAVGTMKRFNMAMAGYGESISSGTVYTLVQSQGDIYNGATYLIYGSGYVLGEQKTNNRGAVAVTPENNEITIDNTIGAYPVIIEAVSGGYSIKDINNSGYLYNDKSDKNYLKNTADLNAYTTWTISINEGVAHIDNVNTSVRGKMGYNPNNNSPLFAAYSTIPTGGTSDLALYIDLTTAVPDTRLDAGLSWSSDSANASIEDGDIIQFTAPTLSNLNGVTGITYESTETSVATVSSEGAVTVIAAGTTTIKAIFAGDTDYKPQTVSYTLTVTDNRTPVNPNTSTEDNPYSADDAINLAQTLSSSESIENVYVSGIISRITTAFNSQYNNVTFMISADGSTTGEFEIFRMPATSADDFLVGDAVEIKGTLVNYNGNTPEISAGADLINQLHKPTFTPDGGNFTTSQSVSISAASGATIKYSLDGTAPSITYSSALSLTETTTVKAIAISGILVTGVATATFTKSGDNPTPQTVTYTVQSTSSVSVSGTAPSGSSATYSSTYTSKCQLTSGNSMTLTLSGFAGKEITGLVLSMKSNSSKGAGYMYIKSGSTTFGSIGSDTSGVNFNNSSWHGSWSTSYVNVTIPVTATTVGNNENVEIRIGATTNSLYCESFTITYN